MASLNAELHQNPDVSRQVMVMGYDVWKDTVTLSPPPTVM